MSSMKNKSLKPFLYAAIIVVIALIILLPKLTGDEEKKNTAGPAGLGGPVPVQISIVKKEVFENTFSATGSIVSDEAVDLVPEINGKITHIYFKEGSFVQKGTLLVKINDAELQAQLKKAVSRKKLAEDKVFRQKTLFERDGISREALDIAQNELDLVLADIELLESQIEKTEIVAPFPGTVGLRSVSEGSYVTPAHKITSIQNNTSVKIDFSIPQRYMYAVKQGMPLTFKVSGSNKEYRGSVYAIEPGLETSSRSLKIRARAANDGTLKPGAFADVKLNFSGTIQSIFIPTETVVPDLRGHYVFKASGGKAVVTPVSIGLRNESNVHIEDGLQEGDTLIVSGIVQLRPNGEIKIVGKK